jgi:hypothetical protein
MNGLVSLDGAEGIASVGVSGSGWSIYLVNNPILTNAIALANTEYIAGTLVITGNTNLECVPSAWPATDKNDNTIPHGSCPTTPAPTPTPGSIGSTGENMLIVITIIAALTCAAGFVYYRWRVSAAHKKGDPLQKPLLGADELEMVSLGKAAEGMAPKDAVFCTGFARTQAEKDACVTRWSEGADSAHGHSLNNNELQIDFNDIQLHDASIIGDGASCIVYKASVFGKVCAVKVLAVNASEWNEQQFDSEVKLLSAVQHANLCRYYACSTNGPQKCLLLELIDTSLDKRLVAQPALGWQQCVHIALSICRGLSYLHSLAPPIIHRDVKSQNVLLNGFTTDVLDEVSEAKVADFGTVRASELRITDELTTNGNLKTDGKTHATTGKVVGTGPYMPQEYAGFGHVSAKTDAFAMGIVVIELLISGSMQTAAPEDLPFKARQLVDSKDAADLTAAIEAMAADGGWGDGSALRAAKVLASVAVSCTHRTEKRQTPAMILGRIEEAYELVDSDNL